MFGHHPGDPHHSAQKWWCNRVLPRTVAPKKLRKGQLCPNGGKSVCHVPAKLFTQFNGPSATFHRPYTPIQARVAGVTRRMAKNV